MSDTVYIFRTIPVMPMCLLVPCLSIIFLQRRIWSWDVKRCLHLPYYSCYANKEVREPIIQKIDRILNDCKLNWRKLSENVQLQLLLDITASTRNLKLDPASVANIEYCYYSCYANVFIGSLPIHYLSATQDMKLGCQTPGTVFNFCYTGWV
jgi:hypothetical protein